MFSTPEDEMGSPQPSARAWLIARKYLREGQQVGLQPLDEAAYNLAMLLDDFHAAALTDEQRDVLTVWEYVKSECEDGERPCMGAVDAADDHHWWYLGEDIPEIAAKVRKQGAK